MIAVWMLYCLGIGLAFVIVGHALERGLHLAGRATRWAWVIAIVGSYLVPVAAWIRPDAFATFAAPIPQVTVSATSSILHLPSRPLSLSDLDAALRWGWILASVAMVVTVVVAATRLRRLRRRWRRTAVDGRMVLVSPDMGPAVVGVWRPRVVVPEWALALPVGERELMLAHEEQHVRGGDPALLAVAFAAWLLAPWNPALWWQWRRLRLAVEMDCDARVLAQGRSAPAYAELLLEVGGRRTGALANAAAFGEPVSFLESRIRRIIGTLPRWRWAGVAGAVIVAAGALVGACETPRPLAPAERIHHDLPDSLSMDSAVDERAQIVEAPMLIYPDLLRRAGIEGRVIVQLIVGVNGRAEPGSVKVVDSPNPGFDQTVINWVLRVRFRPALVRQRAVRVLMNLPVEFRRR